MNNFKDILKNVRENEPKLPYKEAMKKASAILKEKKENGVDKYMQEAKEALNNTEMQPKIEIDTQKQGKKEFDIADIEKIIDERYVGNINNIKGKLIGAGLIENTHYKIIEKGKQNVNTIITLKFGDVETKSYRVFMVKPVKLPVKTN